MSSILRRASTEQKTIYLGKSKDEFLVVREDISKAEYNAIASAMPRGTGENSEDLSIAEATKFQTLLFTALVVGWSLAEGAPTLKDYEGLSAASGLAVDSAVADHFGTLVPSSAEGK